MTAPEAGWLRSKSSIAVRAPEPYGHTCDTVGTLGLWRTGKLSDCSAPTSGRLRRGGGGMSKKAMHLAPPRTVSFATARARTRVTTSFKGQDGCTASAALFAVCLCLEITVDQAHQPENGGGHFAALNKRFTCHARAMTQSRGLHFQVCLQDATLICCGGRAKGGGAESSRSFDLSCPAAAGFGLTFLLVRRGRMSTFGICFQAFAQGVHQVDDVTRLFFRLGSLDGMTLGLALNELP